MWLSGNHKLMCKNRLTAVLLASHNPMNGGTEYNKGINGMERRKIDKEWKNQKECGGFCDSWDCFLLAIIVSIILIDGIFVIFIFEKIRTEYIIKMSTCQNKHHKKYIEQQKTK